MGYIKVILVSIGVWLTINHSMSDNMKKLESELCDGHTDFVFATDGLEAPFVEESPNPFEGSSEVTPKAWTPGGEGVTITQEAVLEIISVGMHHRISYSFKPETFGLKLSIIDAWTTEEASAFWNPGCTDNAGFQCCKTFRLMAGYYYEIASFTTCSDLLALGDDTVTRFCNQPGKEGEFSRAMCPQLCGCAAPNTSLFLKNAGCPANCPTTTSYQNVMNSLSCSNPSTAELLNGNYWTSFVAGLRSLPHPTMVMIGDLMQEMGCQAFNETHPLAQPYAGYLTEFCRVGKTLPMGPISFTCPASCKCDQNYDENVCPRSCADLMP